MVEPQFESREVFTPEPERLGIILYLRYWKLPRRSALDCRFPKGKEGLWLDVFKIGNPKFTSDVLLGTVARAELWLPLGQSASSWTNGLASVLLAITTLKTGFTYILFLVWFDSHCIVNWRREKSHCIHLGISPFLALTFSKYSLKCWPIRIKLL